MLDGSAIPQVQASGFMHDFERINDIAALVELERDSVSLNDVKVMIARRLCGLPVSGVFKG